MNDSASYRNDRTGANGPQTVAGLLTTALNMEDQIGGGVYEEYRDRAHWPATLDEQVFSQIRERLTTLIEDTRKHRKILEALIREHGTDE